MKLVEFTFLILPEGLEKLEKLDIAFGEDQVAEWSYPSIGFIRNSSDFVRSLPFYFEIATEHANQRSTIHQHRQKKARNGEIL